MEQLISPLILLPGIGMILVAICTIWLWQRQKASLWAAVWWGALAWVISVTIKIVASWSTNDLTQGHSGNPLTWLYTGLLTGVFECVIPLLVIRTSCLRSADWDRAVAFGIGFGGIEAFLLGMVSLGAALWLLIYPAGMPVEVRDALVQRLGNYSITSISLPIVERAATLLIHVLSSVLLVYAVRVRQQRWFWAAFAYKSAIDGFAGWAILAWGANDSVEKITTVEEVVIVFAIIAVVTLSRLEASFTRLDCRCSVS